MFFQQFSWHFLAVLLFCMNHSSSHYPFPLKIRTITLVFHSSGMRRGEMRISTGALRDRTGMQFAVRDCIVAVRDQAGREMHR